MTGSVLTYEWKHFVRNRFKLLALFLFVLASIYGLHNGASLYQKQKSEIERIQEKVADERAKVVGYFEEDKTVSEERPWIDYSTPFWSIWFSWTYHFKDPSPAMVYSLGQSEQYGYYKRITFWANPYDADLVEEIANPERLQIGKLDFSFAILFLMPLLLLILVYGIKSVETEQGFMPMVEVQSTAKKGWILKRLSFYVFMLVDTLILLTIYGAFLTDLFSESLATYISVLALSIAYLLLWSVIFYFVLLRGQSIMGNTLMMIGIYLLVTFIIPGAIHQYVGIKMPANLMTDFIDVRDQQQDLYNLPDSVFRAELYDLFPEIVNSPIYQDSTRIQKAVNESTSSLVNELKKESIKPIEEENLARRDLIASTFWFNPLSFFQNQFNRISTTHFDDYQNYRDEIQLRIDRQIQLLVTEVWRDSKVDQAVYENYYLELSNSGEEE